MPCCFLTTAAASVIQISFLQLYLCHSKVMEQNFLGPLITDAPGTQFAGGGDEAVDAA